MHAPTLVVAAVALLSTSVIAQDRPKFYFPRQVKREISNTTSNSLDDNSSSTKRDLIGDLLGVLTGGSAPETGAPVASVKPVASDAGVAPGVVKTVIVSNTVVVNNGVTTTLGQAPPSSVASTTASGVSSVKPPLIVLPTLSLGLSSVLQPILSPSSVADGVTAPSGVLGSSGVLAPSPTESSTASGVTFSGTGTGASSSTDTGADYQTLSSSSGGGLLSSLIGGLIPTGTGAATGTGATTTFEPSSSVPTPTASSTGLESMISSIISSGTAGTGVTVFPTGSGTNSTTHRVSPVPTGGDVSSHNGGNGTAIVLPPTTTKKPVSPTLLPTTTATDVVPTTSDWVGSSILIQTTQSGEKASTTVAIPSGIPSTLPQVVAPLNGVPTPKVGYTLIQVGFTYALNYQFVVANSMSSAQIFTYLPKGIAYGLEIKESDVIMHSLQPYDTSRTLNYITTLALAYIPTQVVSNLGIMIHVPVSRLYKNPSEPVDVIMSSINPSIPITVGSGLDGSGPAAPVGGDGSSPTPGGGKDGSKGNGIFDSNADNQTPGAKGMTAGIATGAVVAAAAYGAAMFFIARRYKKRKLSHRRARSLMNPAEMMEASGSPALPGGVYMSGGRQSTGSGESGSGSSEDRHSRGSGRSAGNSARTAQISGPMMAENSLGWN
ncbi:hypothetical protein V495_00849 [Pseudogymnoascus sp. VKM F-4514 (FW-929)]|nr:hypothetical protein V495_00849 [Pseudogymnoascus sp. VKM F-4514 (FW-929)]KFY61048.1 hypothetical protein V497_03174 [Pseudogymnoascus sp. VKM F-4516 (FW-969)]